MGPQGIQGGHRSWTVQASTSYREGVEAAPLGVEQLQAGRGDVLGSMKDGMGVWRGGFLVLLLPSFGWVGWDGCDGIRKHK